MPPKMIVAEVSKNWHKSSALIDTPLCELFEELIIRNHERGYVLHSWRLNRINDSMGTMNETIIAVFQQAGGE